MMGLAVIFLTGTNPNGIQTAESGGTIANRGSFPGNFCTPSSTKFLGVDLSPAIGYAESLNPTQSIDFTTLTAAETRLRLRRSAAET